MSYSKIICCIVLVVIYSNILSAVPQIKDTSGIYSRLDKMDESVREVRRDQLNYQIERDLLKEAYSTNYQTVNIVLAIVLGVFSLIGFLGLRDIGSIKKEYIEELDKLNTLRKEFETKVLQYESEQKKAIENFTAISKTNDEQNRRIKILELQEKILSLMSSKNYQRALEYVAIALEIDPNNASFHMRKALSLWRVGDLPGAISSYSQADKLEPDNILIIENLIELYLLTKRFDEYSALYLKYKQAIASKDGSAMCFYFESLELYMKANSIGLKKAISDFLATATPDKQNRTGGWDYTDATKALKPNSDQELGQLFLLLVSFLHGEVGRDEALKKLEQIK